MKFNFNSIDLGISGGNRTIFELSNALVDLGNTVTINYVGKELPTWFTPIKAKVIHNDISCFNKLLNKINIKQLDVMAEKQKLLLKNMPDCDINVAGFWPTAAPTYRSHKGKPIYLVQHYEPLFYPSNSKLYQQAKETYTYPLKRICVSNWLAKEVNGNNIGNGINLNKFKRLNTPKIKNSIMLSFRTNAYKNAESTKQVANKLASLGFKIIGVHENISDSLLIDYYNQAELYVNLTDKEGFGLNMLEAMACGCLVISTKCSEYLSDNNSYLLPYNPSIDLVLGTIQSVINDTSKELKIKNGFATASEHDFSNTVNQFLKGVAI